MNKYFPMVGRIEYRPDAGPEETCVFRHYNATETVHGRTMEEWLRFAPCYFNLFRYMGTDNQCGERTHQRPWDDGLNYNHKTRYPGMGPDDMFGDRTHHQPTQMHPLLNWEDGSRSMENYKRRMCAAFEFFSKLGVKYYSASDRDLAPEGNNLEETNRFLEEATAMAFDLQRQTGIRPLYFAADLFSHPRYMNGAATNPDAHVFSHACAQVKRAMDIAKRLNAENFVFFNPRDGYQSPLQRQMYRDMTHLGNLYRMAVQYKEKIGFRGQLMIQPKPYDPLRCQYESCSMSTMHILRHFGLERHFKLYIKPAWSRMMGRPYYHDVYMASAFNMLGMVDASDSLPGTYGASDVSARDVHDAATVMKCVLEQGGFQNGGFTMACHLRRESIEPRDMFHAMILTMDTFAKALKIAAKMISDGYYARNLQQRYVSYKAGIGERLDKGASSFEECEDYIRKYGEPIPQSSHHERMENMFNSYVYPACPF